MVATPPKGWAPSRRSGRPGCVRAVPVLERALRKAPLTAGAAVASASESEFCSEAFESPQNTPFQILSIESNVIQADQEHYDNRCDLPHPTEARIRVNFATKPENGGRPASDSAATKNAAAMIGSRLAIFRKLPDLTGAVTNLDRAGGQERTARPSRSCGAAGRRCPR